MISNKIKGLVFDDWIYKIDTRSFRVTECDIFPDRLFILDSDPISREELLEFLTIFWNNYYGASRILNLLSWVNNISKGFMPLRYIYVIPKEKGLYYILNRYFKKIDWKKIFIPSGEA